MNNQYTKGLNSDDLEILRSIIFGYSGTTISEIRHKRCLAFK